MCDNYWGPNVTPGNGVRQAIDNVNYEKTVQQQYEVQLYSALRYH